MNACSGHRTVWVFLLAGLAACAEAAAQASPAAQGPRNLFANPSFEDGRTAWHLGKGGATAAQYSVDEALAAAGRESALVTIDAVEEWGVQFGQNFEAGAKGRTYTFAMFARSVKSPVAVRLEVERSASPWDRAVRSAPFALGADRWIECHVTFTVEKDYPEGWFAYVSCEQPRSAFRIDMVRLYEGPFVPYEEAAAEEIEAATVVLFDTGTPSKTARSPEDVGARSGWTRVPEGQTTHAFAGDAVLANDRLAVAVRRLGGGAEVYALGTGGPRLRARLAPGGVGAAARLDALAIAENDPGVAAVEVAFGEAGGKGASLRLELALGSPFVKASPGPNTTALRVEAPCRFAVLPDFFADDMVIDAREIPGAAADLPVENFMLQMLADGASILMTVASVRGGDARVSFVGEGAARALAACKLPLPAESSIWVGLIEGAGVWHARDVGAADAGRILPLDWRMPFPAQWRVDWRKADALTDSWVMALEKRGGEFEKPAMFGSPTGLPASRNRWTTVLGSFPYPCWIDSAGRGHVQPLKNRAVRYEGPALVYPLGRVTATPLDAFTVADIARATLGVGPCEYVLDVEGQGQTYKGRATCATRDALRAIYAAGQQKEKRAEIERILDEVSTFVKHIRERIEEYQAFGRAMRSYLEELKRARPDLAPFADDMAKLARALEDRYERRKGAIRPPAYAQGLIDRFRTTLVDYEGADALDRCKEITEAIVEVGGNQDELVGECRMAVKILRQRAGLAVAADPAAAEAAREIRRRTQEILRNPTTYEAATH